MCASNVGYVGKISQNANGDLAHDSPFVYFSSFKLPAPAAPVAVANLSVADGQAAHAHEIIVAF